MASDTARRFWPNEGEQNKLVDLMFGRLAVLSVKFNPQTALRRKRLHHDLAGQKRANTPLITDHVPAFIAGDFTPKLHQIISPSGDAIWRCKGRLVLAAFTLALAGSTGQPGTKNSMLKLLPA